MSKQSYFSHDSNARNSEKLIQVRMSLGAEGYGVYFMILERLREEKSYMSVKDYNIIAFDLRVDASIIKQVVENFGLFVFTDNGKYFYSESFLRRMKIKDEKSKKKSEAGKKGAAKRWGDKSSDGDKNADNIAELLKDNSSVIAVPTENIASKVKESKVNKIKDKDMSASAEAGLIDKKIFEDDSVEIVLSKYLYNQILRTKSNYKKPNLQTWAKNIDLLIRVDKESSEKIRKVIDYATNNDFWKSNILSTAALRKNFAQLEIQMSQSKNTKLNNKSGEKYKPKMNFDNDSAEMDSIRNLIESRGVVSE